MGEVIKAYNVKADTWYKLKNGKLTECKEVI